MKKMQCEVCGSTEIKRESEDVFVCQSCGLQYSKTDVQKIMLDIDHAAEIQNYIKRGSRFEESGDFEKAEEYYNQALDLDAENEFVQESIKRVQEKKAWEDLYIVEANIDPEKNVENFLNQLATEENIACDVYKEIEIDSVIEKYTPYFFIKNECEYNWSVTACHYYYENETVYETRYNNGVKEKVPVTKRVQRVARTPVSGSDIFKKDRLVLASDSVCNECISGSESLRDDMIDDFESLQDKKYSDYNCIHISSEKIRQENNSYFYNEIPIDMNVDKALCEQKENEVLKSCDDYALKKIRNHIDADFVENIHCTREVLSRSTVCVFIPIQIINYTYKGQKYTAISDLISRTTTMPLLYPCDSELSAEETVLNQKEENANKKSGLFIAGVIAGIVGAVFLAVASFSNSSAVGFPAIALLMVSVGLMIGGVSSKKAKRNEFLERQQKAEKELFNPRKQLLSDSHNNFSRNYSDSKSIKNAQQCITEEFPQITTDCRISLSGALSD